MESSHRWTFVRYFGTQQVPIGMPGRTDGQTDNGAKNNMSPHFMGGDINIPRMVASFLCSDKVSNSALNIYLPNETLFWLLLTCACALNPYSALTVISLRGDLSKVVVEGVVVVRTGGTACAGLEHTTLPSHLLDFVLTWNKRITSSVIIFKF